MKVIFDVWYRCVVPKKRWNQITKKLYKKESGFGDRCTNIYMLMTYKQLFNFLMKNHFCTIGNIGDSGRDIMSEKTMQLLMGVKEVKFRDYFHWIGTYKTVRVRIHGVQK